MLSLVGLLASGSSTAASSKESETLGGKRDRERIQEYVSNLAPVSNASSTKTTNKKRSKTSPPETTTAFHVPVVLPASSVVSFLESLLVNKDKITNEDWTLLESLAQHGLVALSSISFNQLLRTLLQHRRFDILSLLLAHSIDLSERQAIDALVAVVALSDVEKQEKTQKSKSKAVESSSGGDTVVLTWLSRLLRALTSRKVGFANVSLTEAIKQRTSPSLAALLLRLCAWQLSSEQQQQEEQQLQQLDNDSDNDGSVASIQQLVVWTESLLDAHHSAFALQAVREDGAVQAALRGVMQAVLLVDAETLEATETAIGLASHLHRMNCFTFPNQKPIRLSDLHNINNNNSNNNNHHRNSNTATPSNDSHSNYTIETLIL